MSYASLSLHVSKSINLINNIMSYTQNIAAVKHTIADINEENLK